MMENGKIERVEDVVGFLEGAVTTTLVNHI